MNQFGRERFGGSRRGNDMSKQQARVPEGLEERYEKYRGILKDLTIMSDMYSSILANRVYELKETQKGVEFMCHEMEDIMFVMKRKLR